MSLSNFLVCLVFLQLLTAIVASRNLVNGKMSKRNVSSTSCKNVQFDEAKLADVLHLMRKSVINTIKITVTVSSANRTRVFPEMKWVWANEIGRTLMSLISRAESMFASAIYTFPLEVGMEKVSMEVTEEPTGCLPSGKEGLDLVFDSLLDKLFLHMEDKDKDMYYKLCRPYDDNKGPVQFKCCGILGDGKLSICGDYSSIVLQWTLPGLIVGVVIISTMTLPFLLEYIITYKDKMFYETSFSHMSLTSTVSMIFFEGQGPTKSLFRRCAFVAVTLVVLLLTDFLGIWQLKILFAIWALLFCSNMEFDMSNKKGKLFFVKKLVSCFSEPSILFNYMRNSHINNSATPFHCAPENIPCIKSDFFKRLFSSLIVCLSALIYFTLVFPLLVAGFLTFFLTFHFMLRFIDPYSCVCEMKIFKKSLVVFIRLLTFIAIVFLMVSLLIFVLSIIVGVILNGEFFNPFIAPVVTLIIFFWKNWKFSVEAQCLQLKTLIIDVCNKKIESAQKESANVPTTNLRLPNNEESLTISNVSNEVNRGGNTVPTRSNDTTTSNQSRTTSPVLYESDDIDNGEAVEVIREPDNSETSFNDQTTVATCHVPIDSDHGENGGIRGTRSNDTTISNTVSESSRGQNGRPDESTAEAYSEGGSTQVQTASRTNRSQMVEIYGVANGGLDEPDIEETSFITQTTSDATSRVLIDSNHSENGRQESAGEPDNEGCGTEIQTAPKTNRTLTIQSCSIANGGVDEDICEPDIEETIFFDRATLDATSRVSIDNNHSENGRQEIAGEPDNEGGGSEIQTAPRHGITNEGADGDIGDPGNGETSYNDPTTSDASSRDSIDSENGVDTGADRDNRILLNTPNMPDGEQTCCCGFRLHLNRLFPCGNCCAGDAVSMCRRSDGNGEQESESRADDVDNFGEENLTIKFTDTGEARISKVFFKEVSKIVLPLDHVLFCFFRRVLFVGIYAWIMFIVMILVQETGLSGSVQAISAIVAILVPFVFDTIYADHHSAQKHSKKKAMKQRLACILQICGSQKNVFFFELVKIECQKTQDLTYLPKFLFNRNNEELLPN